MFQFFEKWRSSRRHENVRTGQRVPIASILMDRLRAKENQSHLEDLTPQRAAELFENYRAGKYADLQLTFDELEEKDDTLKTVVDSRIGGLAEMPWRVTVDAEAVGEDEGRKTLADAQQKYLTDILNQVENLDEGIEHLGMADFRGFAALEVVRGAHGGVRLEPIEPWLLARPVRSGPWYYNEKANDDVTAMEALEMDRVILRETRRPIDLAAMFLIVEKCHAGHAWDAFLDTYGVPPIFFELPPNTSEEDGLVYDVVCNQIIAEGRGTMPSGTKVQTVETGQNSSEAYRVRAEWCRDAILMLGLGGTLTATTEAGSGTLAGNAHSDSLSRLCARSARGVAQAVNQGLCYPALRRKFPGQPILASFDISFEEEEDMQVTAQVIATLAGARYRMPDEAVSEKMGVDVQTEAAQPATPGYLGGVMSRTNTETIEGRETEPAGEPPLTEGELEFMKQAAGAGAGTLEALAGKYEKELEGAARAGLEGKRTEKALETP